MITNEEIFNIAEKRFTDDKGRCSKNNLCLYETEDGQNNCVIGAMIPKNLITQEIKDFAGSIYSLVVKFSTIRNFFHEGLTGEDEMMSRLHLLNSLQTLHDLTVNWNDDGRLNNDNLEKFYKIKKDFLDSK